jgi:hypothetical protein
MKMRRVPVEVLVDASEFADDKAVVACIENGVQDGQFGSRYDVMVLREGDVVDFDYARWARLKAAKM